MISKITLDGKHFSLTYWSIISTADLLEGFRDRLKPHNRKVTEYIVSEEIGSEGGRHMHAYFVLDSKIRGSFNEDIFDVHGVHPNIQHTRRESDWAKYVVKDGKYITNIQRKIDKAIKEKPKDKDEIARELIAGKSLAELTKENPRLLFEYARLRQALQLFRLDTITLVSLGGPCGMWIAGPPGAGKTLICQKRFPGNYSKNCTKWWDGYKAEETVCLQDVDYSWKDFIPCLKIWADSYPFDVETKNGTIRIRPAKVVVTSNYTIDELFQTCGIKCTSMLGAIHRRFKSMWITSEEDYEEQL